MIEIMKRGLYGADKFDKTLKLYSLMTTKPEEVEKREKEMEAEEYTKFLRELFMEDGGKA